MKNRFTAVYAWTRAYGKAHKPLSIFIIIILFISGILSYRAAASGSTTPKYVLASVNNGTFIGVVTGTGQISAANQVDIKPQGSSQSAETITEVDVKQGDTVKAGQLIAVVDNKSAKISLEQAQNSLASAEASYNKLVNGSTQTQLLSYQSAVTNAEQNLANKIASSYTTIDNAIRSNIDPLFSNPTTDGAAFSPSSFDSTTNDTTVFTITDSTQAAHISLERRQIGQIMTTWKQAIDAFSGGDPTDLATLSDNNASTLRTFISDTGIGVDSLTGSGTKFDSTIQQFKSDVGSARASIDSALTDITSSEQSLTSAKTSLTQQTAPARPEDVATSKAQLDNARTSLQSAQDNYNQSFLRAPFDGVIAKVGVSVGDQANTSTLVATIITKQQLATISLNEVDAAKVKLGDPAILTFDAIPDLTISGDVAQIDTIGTVTQGVVNYSAQIAFDTQDDRVKPGMSVSVSITTDTENNVLLVPNAAIKSDARGSYVQELPGVVGASISTGSATGAGFSGRTGGRGNRTASTTNSTGNSFASTTATTTGFQGRQFGTGSTSGQRNIPTTVTTTQTPLNVPVTVGASNDTYTVVTSGLQPGDKIITQTISGNTSATTATRSTTSILGGGARAGGGGFGGGARGGAAPAGR